MAYMTDPRMGYRWSADQSRTSGLPEPIYPTTGFPTTTQGLTPLRFPPTHTSPSPVPMPPIARAGRVPEFLNNLVSLLSSPGPARNRVGGLLGSGTAGRPAPRSAFWGQPSGMTANTLPGRWGRRPGVPPASGNTGYQGNYNWPVRAGRKRMGSPQDFFQALQNAGNTYKPLSGFGNPYIGY